MRTRSRSLLVVLLLMGGSVLEASARSNIMHRDNWTFRIGGHRFGFEGYRMVGRKYITIVHYGFGTFYSTLPVQAVAALSGALPLLGVAGYLFFVRRRPENPR